MRVWVIGYVFDVLFLFIVFVCMLIGCYRKWNCLLIDGVKWIILVLCVIYDDIKSVYGFWFYLIWN